MATPTLRLISFAAALGLATAVFAQTPGTQTSPQETQPNTEAAPGTPNSTATPGENSGAVTNPNAEESPSTPNSSETTPNGTTTSPPQESTTPGTHNGATTSPYGRSHPNALENEGTTAPNHSSHHMAMAGKMESHQASKLIGMNVENESGDTIGEVKDVILNREGQATEAVVSYGGTLGVGATTVAIPWQTLQSAMHGRNIVMSKSQLESAPRYQEGRSAPANGESPNGTENGSSPEG